MSRFVPTSIRKLLAAAFGTSLIGHQQANGRQVTAQARLRELDTLTANVSANRARMQSINMHYGVCRGVGFLPTESGGVAYYTTTSAVAAGASVVPVTDASHWLAGQLLCYMGSDGQYYSTVVESIVGNNVTLQSPTEIDIPLGNKLVNFYLNESHPNQYGASAIVDYALRNAMVKSEMAVKWRESDEYVLIGAPTISTDATNTYGNPGSAAHPALVVLGTGAAQGIQTPDWTLPAGEYIARVVLTPNSRAASPYTESTQVSVAENTTAAITTIASASCKGRTPQIVTLPFSKKRGSKCHVEVRVNGAGTHSFSVSKIEIMSIADHVKTLDRGTHVLLGDSWFALGDTYNRLVERLPKATIINKGVGGNRMDQLYGRFDADVTPNAPDFVWLMAGTNDYGQAFPVSVYTDNMNLIKAKLTAIGAHGMIFMPSVGATAHSTLGNLRDPSREYALNTDCDAEMAAPVPTNPTPRYTDVSVAASIPANSTITLAILAGTTTRAATLEKMLVTGSSGNVHAGYSSNPANGITEGNADFPIGVTTYVNQVVAKPNSNDRYFVITAQNTTGAAVAIAGFVRVKWYPS